MTSTSTTSYIKKSKLKFFVALLIMISIIFISFTAESKEFDEISKLTSVFKESGAELKTYWLHIGIPFEQLDNDQDLLKKGNQLSKSFGLPQMEKLETVGKEKVYHSTGSWSENTEVELQIKGTSHLNSDTYLVFKLKGTKDLEAIKDHYKRLTQMLENIQIYPQINTCLQGTINDKLNSDQQLVYIEGMLHKLEAARVEELDTNLVKSISAYSPLFPYAIKTGQKQMNVQIATHFNSLDQNTVITLGTPIITIEY